MSGNAKTYRDLFQEIYEKYGIQTTTQFHINPDKQISEEKYQEALKAYLILPAIFDDTFGRDEDA